MSTLKHNSKILLATLLTATFILSGCDSLDDDNNNPEVATFSLGISDAPVDDISQLNICFSAIELKPTGEGEVIIFMVGDDVEAINANSICPDSANTAGINLLDFVGDDAELFINNAEIALGSYKLRIIMSEGSFAYPLEGPQTEETKIPVDVPSNELKLVNTLTFAQGGQAAYTLEFDLQKSMVNAPGQEGYKLKPTGVRLVNNTEVGTLTGTVAEVYLSDASCAIGQSDGTTAGSVYLYEEGITEFGDIGSQSEPYATGKVISNGAGTYSYEIGFILAGNYTVGVTCSEDDSDMVDEGFTIISTQTTIITAETSMELNF
ncbi:DUF4382 domain-containing protein [Colwellia piezophila]|uniref:DUF4382 domain-containing protein n=1 Tax=Colwellia piezophila TaxID=211668 RepID=UPI000371E836|nr:DUF4382 domain-containing protein [Colwellia piezophila]